MNYKRESIGDNIGFSTITDEKFNTCSLYVRFITELDSETASANAMGVGMMSISNGTLKTMAEMNNELSNLYGANIGTFAGKKGDFQILGLSASWICNKFALENEDIDQKMLEIIHDCIFKPNAENGRFDDTSFKIVKNNILDSIDSELNDKRSYALIQSQKLAFKGEPAENRSSGTREQAEAVTPESAFTAYENFLKTAQIEIFCITPTENKAVPEMFRRSFLEISRCTSKHNIRRISPLKAVPETLTEELDVKQCKIVLEFKSDCDDIYALRLLSIILGETPFSKLFVNVREKLSLCYYCSCHFSEIKNLLTVDCGVERDNIEKAVDEILHQLEEIINGNISDEEIQNALLALDNSYTAVGDTPSSYYLWYFNMFCIGEKMTPEEQFEKFCAVTKEQLTKAAASLKLDSRYYMLNKENIE